MAISAQRFAGGRGWRRTRAEQGLAASSSSRLGDRHGVGQGGADPRQGARTPSWSVFSVAPRGPRNSPGRARLAGGKPSSMLRTDGRPGLPLGALGIVASVEHPAPWKNPRYCSRSTRALVPQRRGARRRPSTTSASARKRAPGARRRAATSANSTPASWCGASSSGKAPDRPAAARSLGASSSSSGPASAIGEQLACPRDPLLRVAHVAQEPARHLPRDLAQVPARQHVHVADAGREVGAAGGVDRSAVGAIHE